MTESLDLCLPPACCQCASPHPPISLGLIQLPGSSHRVLTGVQKVCSPGPGRRGVTLPLSKAGGEAEVAWLCSLQQQTIINTGGGFRPPLSSVWFFCPMQGAALGAQLPPGIPRTRDPQGLALPGPAHSPGTRRSHRRAPRTSGRTGAAGRAGRPAPARNVFIGIREPPAPPPLRPAIAERHLSILCQASWPLTATFIWFTAASGGAGRGRLSSVIGWPR